MTRPSHWLHKRLWLIIGIIVVSGLLTVFALTFLRNQTLSTGRQVNESFARIVQEQTDRTLQSIDQRLQIAATSLTQLQITGKLDERSARAMLREQIREIPFVRAMWVMDAKGNITYDSDNDKPGVNLAGRAYFQIYITQPRTLFFLGQPERNGKGLWAISAARPLHNAIGEFAGIVVAELDPGYFDKLWSQLNLGVASTVTLFRSDSVMMVRSPMTDALIGKSYPELPIFRQLAGAADSGVFDNVSPFDNVQRQFAYRTLALYPAVVVVGRSQEMILGQWTRMAGLVVGLWTGASTGLALLCLFLVRDTSKRKKAERRLVTSEDKLKTILDAVPDLMFELDINGRYHDYHSPRTDLLAVPPEVFIGKRVHDILAPEAAAIIIEGIQQANQLGYTSGQQIALQLDHGHRWFELSIARKALLPDEEQRFIVLSRDVTERKLAQEALQESEKSLNEAQCLAQIGSYKTDLKTGRWTSSAALDQIFGIDESFERTIENWGKLMAPGYETLMIDYYNRVVHSDGRFVHDYEVIRRSDGQRRWVSALGTFIYDADGTPLLLRGTIQDVTESKWAEALLQATVKEKTALLNEVHHRVKNNLQVITSLLRLEASRSSQSDIKAVLGDMQGRIRSMAMLHESLYRTGTFASVDLGNYLRQLAQQAFRSSAPQTGAVRLELNLADVHATLDQATPCGLLVNELIANSFKHGFPDGQSGEVRVSLQPVEATPTHQPLKQVRLVVSDTGVGLPADFELHRSTSLGLLLVSDLAAQLGGKLQIGLRPGTVFSVVFSIANSK
jgi:PAS domain S-box-containing protein